MENKLSTCFLVFAIIFLIWFIFKNKKCPPEHEDCKCSEKGVLEKAKESLLDMKNKLTNKRDGLSDTREGLSDTREGLSDTREGLSDTREGLSDTREGLSDTRESLSDTRESLSDTREGLHNEKVRGKGYHSSCAYDIRSRNPVVMEDCIDEIGAMVDYNTAMQVCALEPDISKSHTKWISELTHKTPTSSKDTVRDDPNDIVPWVGLRRTKYKTAAQPLFNSRVVPSDIPCDMLDDSDPYKIY